MTASRADAAAVAHRSLLGDSGTSELGNSELVLLEAVPVGDRRCLPGVYYSQKQSAFVTNYRDPETGLHASVSFPVRKYLEPAEAGSGRSIKTDGLLLSGTNFFENHDVSEEREAFPTLLQEGSDARPEAMTKRQVVRTEVEATKSVTATGLQEKQQPVEEDKLLERLVAEQERLRREERENGRSEHLQEHRRRSSSISNAKHCESFAQAVDPSVRAAFRRAYDAAHEHARQYRVNAFLENRNHAVGGDASSDPRRDREYDRQKISDVYQRIRGTQEDLLRSTVTMTRGFFGSGPSPGLAASGSPGMRAGGRDSMRNTMTSLASVGSTTRLGFGATVGSAGFGEPTGGPSLADYQKDQQDRMRRNAKHVKLRAQSILPFEFADADGAKQHHATAGTTFAGSWTTDVLTNSPEVQMRETQRQLAFLRAEERRITNERLLGAEGGKAEAGREDSVFSSEAESKDGDTRRPRSSKNSKLSMSPPYELTAKLAPYMDPHLLLAILHDLRQKKVYPDSVIVPEIVALLKARTELIPLLKEYDPSNDHNDRLRASSDKVDNQKKELQPLLRYLTDASVAAAKEGAEGEPESGATEAGAGPGSESLLNCQSYQSLADLGISKDHLDLYYDWCLSLYKSGLYQMSTSNLAHYEKIFTKIGTKEVLESQTATDDEKKQFHGKVLSIKWGLLAGHIAASLGVEGTPENFAEAAQQILSLDEFLDEETNNGLTKKDILMQRAWLQHWMLFVLLKSGDLESAHSSISRVMELFLSEKYLALISLMCPHMLRYAGAVFLLNKKLKPMTKDLVHVLQQDKQNYSDPVTSFLLALHQDLDFEETKLQLDQMQVLCENDYFLHGANAETIMSNARLAIFTIYCRIHQSVDIPTIANKMSMASSSAEAWIVELIQSGKLSGACIDSDAKGESSVFFPKEESEVYHQVLEKTQNMSFRLALLQLNATALKDKDAKLGRNLTNVSGQLAAHLF
eukprot:g14466.t1